MKKIIMFAFAVMMLFSLGACDSFKPADSITPPSNVYVGMTLTEFKALYPDNRDNPSGTCYYYWGDFAFFEDSEGNPVVARIQRDSSKSPFDVDAYYIASIDAFDKDGIQLSEKRIASLKQGMTVQEVVAWIGNPVTYSDSMGHMKWCLSENIEYLFTFTEKETDEGKDYFLIYISRWDLTDDSVSYPLGTSPWNP